MKKSLFLLLSLTLLTTLNTDVEGQEGASKQPGVVYQDSGDEDGAEEVAAITTDEFNKEFVQITSSDSDAYMALGQRAKASGLTALASQAFRAALRADPDSSDARTALGYVKFAGQWTTPDMVLRERGLVFRNGQWVPVGDATDDEPAPVPEPVKKAAPKKEEKKKASPDDWYDDHTTICEWSEAKLYKSKRYVIKTNIKAEYAKRYGKMLDRYFDRFLSVFKSVIVPGTKYTRSVITIYPDKDTFLKTEKLPNGVGGYYRPTDRIVVGYHGRFGKTGTTRTVLAHEGTHQFQHLVLANGFSNCPIWLIEGLAVIFEAAKWNPKLNRVDLGSIPKDRLDTMKRAVKEGKTIPLKTLFATPKNRFGGFQYANAWSVLYLMIFAKKGKERTNYVNKITQLLTMGRKRRVRMRDVTKVFGGDAGLAKFEEEWKTWLKEVDPDFKPK